MLSGKLGSEEMDRAKAKSNEYAMSIFTSLKMFPTSTWSFEKVDIMMICERLFLFKLH